MLVFPAGLEKHVLATQKLEFCFIKSPPKNQHQLLFHVLCEVNLQTSSSNQNTRLCLRHQLFLILKSLSCVKVKHCQRIKRFMFSYCATVQSKQKLQQHTRNAAASIICFLHGSDFSPPCLYPFS